MRSAETARIRFTMIDPWPDDFWEWCCSVELLDLPLRIPAYSLSPAAVAQSQGPRVFPFFARIQAPYFERNYKRKRRQNGA
jgi:hypothetical protein